MQIFASAGLPREMAAAQSGSSGDSNTNSATTNSANITANDFLQLLVSEMKNQDPTSQTDPNEYINQLVQVNSLEQLVQINSDLGGSSTSSSGTGGSTKAVEGGAAVSQPAAAASGNLSAGASTSTGTGTATSAATRVASALGKAAQTLAPGAAANPYESILSAMKTRAHAGQTSTSNPVR
jgi:flagellar basal-body rod modification protein FlgD